MKDNVKNGSYVFIYCKIKQLYIYITVTKPSPDFDGFELVT